MGERNRATSFTKLNAHSSRSHAVFMVKVERRQEIKLEKMDSKVIKSIKKMESMTSSVLYLVDLAGSERVKKSQVESHRLDEAKKINFSLSALGNCIHALTDPK
jgi:kinesin family protein 5